LAERPFLDLLVVLEHAFEHDLAFGRHQQVLRHGFHHRQRPSAQPAGDGKLVGGFRHLRAHRRGGVVQREVRTNHHHDRQVLALLLGTLVGRTQVAAEIELDAGAVGARQHQPMVRGVVDAGVGIARDHDAGGDVTPGIGGGVGQRRQHTGEVDAGGVHLFLHRRPLDQDRWLGIAQRAADELAHAAEVDAERGLHVGLARQQVADHRHVVPGDVREQERRPAIELFHDAGDVEIGVGCRGIGVQPAPLGHAIQRRTEAGIQNGIR
jgi:hypothetical protein